MIFTESYDESSTTTWRKAFVPLCDELWINEIGYARTPSGFRRNAQRGVAVLHYVVKGKGVCCGKTFSAGKCYIIVPNEKENVISDKDDPYEAYWIIIRGPKTVDFLKRCNLPCHNDVFDFGKVAECVEILHNALFNISPANEYVEASILNAALYQVMALHLSEMSAALSQDTIPQRIKKYITENYFNSISVDSIAQSLNFSRNYLYTLFKNDYGISIQEYILNLRIEKAKELLMNNELLISEVALAVGYSDSLYFSRIFRKKTGISPTQYAKENR